MQHVHEPWACKGCAECRSWRRIPPIPPGAPPIPPVYACRCGRPVAQVGALCKRCADLDWHARHPVPVPWQSGRAA